MPPPPDDEVDGRGGHHKKRTPSQPTEPSTHGSSFVSKDARAGARRPRSARTASQANYVSHAQLHLQIAVSKKGYDKIVATCASRTAPALERTLGLATRSMFDSRAVGRRRPLEVPPLPYSRHRGAPFISA